MVTNTRLKKYRLLFILSITLLIVFILFNNSVKNRGVTSLPVVSNGVAFENGIQAKTLDSEWNGASKQGGFSGKEIDHHGRSLPFTEKTLYKALKRIRINDEAKLIIDHNTFYAMSEMIGAGRVKLKKQELIVLQQMIKKVLPSVIGEQVVEITEKYYQYLQAYAEYEKMIPPHQTIEGHKTQYVELAIFREIYLGKELAQKLFAKYDADMFYMVASMDIQKNTQMSANEKQAEQEKIIARYITETINAYQLNNQYDDYLREKQGILISEGEDIKKQNRLLQALKRHFSADEQQAIAHLPLVVLSH